MANVHVAAQDVESLAESLGPSIAFDELREELHDASSCIERIRDIVRDLKIFSRSQEEKTAPIDVQRVMESTLRMAWNEIRHRARVVKIYGEIGPVEASEARLGQVFLNLIVNAAQAIPEGRVEKNEIRITTTKGSDGNIVIEIADTGPGIPPDVLTRLFTPFFTTKPIGVGTGLGLSICRRIVTSFGGSIDVESRVGKGTVFRVVLPPAVSPEDDASPAAPIAAAARRRGRILVVDDEQVIVKVIQRILAAAHEVVALTDAEVALARVRAGERFDVILCDLMMPQVTGMEVHAELLKIDRGQAERMVFLTGGAFTAAARAFLDETPNFRIEKPFDHMQLRALVNDRVR